MLWELDSTMARQYFTAWTICLKLAWKVPRAAHNYFVDHLLNCGMTSFRMDIMAR